MERPPQSPSQPRRNQSRLCQFGDSGRCRLCGRPKPGRPDQKSWATCRMAGISVHAPAPPPRVPQAGPGTELKKLLSRIGITAKPNCKCNARAREMDARGCDWVIENIETVSQWLQEEAQRRGLFYSHIAGQALIHLAVRRARKAMTLRASGQT